MVNTFLKDIEETGYTNEEVLDIIKNYKKPVEEPDEIEDDTDTIKEEDEEEPEVVDDNKKEVDELKNQVKELKLEVNKQLKKLRKAPPKSKETEERGGPIPIIQKNWYEKIV